VRALLLARIDEVRPLLYPRCGGAMRIIAFITEGPVIRRITGHLGEPTRRLRLRPAPDYSKNGIEIPLLGAPEAPHDRAMGFVCFSQERMQRKSRNLLRLGHTTMRQRSNACCEFGFEFTLCHTQLVTALQIDPELGAHITSRACGVAQSVYLIAGEVLGFPHAVVGQCGAASTTDTARDAIEPTRRIESAKAPTRDSLPLKRSTSCARSSSPMRWVCRPGNGVQVAPQRLKAARRLWRDADRDGEARLGNAEFIERFAQKFAGVDRG